MSYTIELSRETAHDIDLLYRSDRQLFQRIINKIEFLEENPFQGSRLLETTKENFLFE
jgi:Txe/YoeB family toxin of Txe-Axe toxin-antitoxin module